VDIGCHTVKFMNCVLTTQSSSAQPAEPQGMHFFFKDPRWQTSTVTTMERLEAGARGFQDNLATGARLPGRRTSSNMQWVVAPWDRTDSEILMTSPTVAPEASCVTATVKMVQTGEIVGTGTAPHWVV
jgi:hypothetical protein